VFGNTLSSTMIVATSFATSTVAVIMEPVVVLPFPLAVGLRSRSK
jgi:hypothetical protein